MKIELNDLYDYIPLKIYQNNSYFKFSLDSVLLAEFVKKPEKATTILDMCSGNGAVSMILSTKTNAKITSVELQKEIFDLGVKSVSYNKLNNQIKCVNSDIKCVENYFPGNKFDVIVCNPPYFNSKNNDLINDERVKAVARHEIYIKLEEIVQIASKLLDLNGEFYMVHRPERLDEIIIQCNKYNLNVKNIQFICTKMNISPKLVLVRCIKGSKNNVKILPNLCIDGLKSFKNIFWKE